METLNRTDAIIDAQFYKIAAELIFHNDEDGLNTWQKIAAATNDIVTPANALDAVGMAGSIYGLANLDNWKGIGIAATSLMTDFLDGKLARATGTQSDLGEAIDASGDKVKLAYGLYQLWKHDMAPRSLIFAIATQNSINIGLTTLDRTLNKKPVIHPSWAGKKGIFLQQWGLGFHVIGNKIAETNQKRGQSVKAAGNIIALTGVTLGSGATLGYGRKLWQAKRKI